MKKLSNEENYKNYQKRKILRWLIMLCAFLTIVFVLCYYATAGYKTGDYTFVFIGLVFFILNVILNRVRESIPINLSEENKKEKEEKKIKKKTNNKIKKNTSKKTK